MKVKVCGMRQPGNIDAVAALGIDMMGFIFYQRSPRYVTELQGDIIAALRMRGVEPVALFVDEELDTVTDTMERYGFLTAQLHGNESPEYCDQLRSRGLKVLKAISISGEDDIDRAALYDGHADMLVLDTKSPGKGGSGVKFNWKLLAAASFTTPYLLSGGISPDDTRAVKAVYEQSGGLMAGVDINSRFETAPALKDVAAVADFMAELLFDI